ncbi:hypothetical protein EON65_40835 [archaeon]|nr:MAG: hypothetical protein EON65_40835 [archaeon]
MFETLAFVSMFLLIHVFYFVQTELSPFTPQRDLAEYCNAGNILLINSEPCCKGIKDHNAKLGELCTKLVMAPEQVLFRWSVTKGYISLIPANTSKSYTGVIFA